MKKFFKGMFYYVEDLSFLIGIILILIGLYRMFGLTIFMMALGIILVILALINPYILKRKG